MQALRHFELRAYLVGIIRAYLNERWISYTGRNGEERRPIQHGVPQGTLLEPIL
jgi:hypothetical protein